MVELIERTGIPKRALRGYLQKLGGSGRLRTARVYRPAIDGTMRPVPVYWVEK